MRGLIEPSTTPSSCNASSMDDASYLPFKSRVIQEWQLHQLRKEKD